MPLPVVTVEAIPARRRNVRSMLLAYLSSKAHKAPYALPAPWPFMRVLPAISPHRRRNWNLLLAQNVAPITVTVPNVVGLQQSLASSVLASSGLTTGVVTPQASPLPIGQVISQAPIAGSTVASGSAVNLVVSAGGPYVLLQDAIRIAVNADLIVTQPIQWAYDPLVPYGYVISQSPAAGVVTPPFTPVYFVASLGPAPVVSQATVPNVAGLWIQDAQNALTNSGCEWGRPVWVYSTVVPGNMVQSQSVTAGTVVPIGTIVILTVSQGPPVTPLPGATVVVPLMH